MTPGSATDYAGHDTCRYRRRQNRPLESIYPFVFMDAIHYKVKEEHRYVTKAAYVVLGITMDGRKDILGV